MDAANLADYSTNYVPPPLCDNTTMVDPPVNEELYKALGNVEPTIHPYFRHVYELIHDLPTCSNSSKYNLATAILTSKLPLHFSYTSNTLVYAPQILVLDLATAASVTAALVNTAHTTATIATVTIAAFVNTAITFAALVNTAITIAALANAAFPTAPCVTTAYDTLALALTFATHPYMLQTYAASTLVNRRRIAYFTQNR